MIWLISELLTAIPELPPAAPYEDFPSPNGASSSPGFVTVNRTAAIVVFVT